MTSIEKFNAAVIEFLEESGLSITSLQGFKLRAIVTREDMGPFGDPGEIEVTTAVNYYSTDDFLRRTALDAPTDNNDLFVRFYDDDLI